MGRLFSEDGKLFSENIILVQIISQTSLVLIRMMPSGGGRPELCMGRLFSEDGKLFSGNIILVQIMS